MQLPLLSHKAAQFTESVIRGMSIEALEMEDEINLETAFMHMTKGITM
jgi:hypothetical protein